MARTTAAAVVLLALVAVGSADAQGRRLQQTCTPLATLTAADPNLSTLDAAIKASGVAVPTTAFTAFGPTNAAFTNLLCYFKVNGYSITLEQLVADTALLSSIINSHIVPGVAATAGSLERGQMLQTANPGTKLQVHIKANTIVRVSTESLTGGLRVSTVATADVAVCNGIGHVVTEVILPPPAVLKPLIAKYKTPVTLQPGCKTLAQVLGAEPDLSLIAAAINALPDLQALAASNATVATLFLPTNAALAAMLASLPAMGYSLSLEQLLQDPALLAAVLKSHVVATAALSTYDLCAPSLETLQAGESLTISFPGPRNLAVATQDTGAGEVVKPNLRACAAWVHAIDVVQLPKAATLVPLMAAYPLPPPPSPLPPPAPVVPAGPDPGDCAARGLPPNTGNGNTGCGNTGSNNVGDFNIGNGNQGNKNTGSNNVGDCNIGNNNTGNGNVLSGNVGDGPEVGCAPPES